VAVDVRYEPTCPSAKPGAEKDWRKVTHKVMTRIRVKGAAPKSKTFQFAIAENQDFETELHKMFTVAHDYIKSWMTSGPQVDTNPSRLTSPRSNTLPSGRPNFKARLTDSPSPLLACLMVEARVGWTISWTLSWGQHLTVGIRFPVWPGLFPQLVLAPLMSV
jgi:hypothetical protein